jgi:hypothetical protein
MGYKMLGFAVWQGAKWYFRQRVSGRKTKAAILGVGALMLAGAAVAGRQATTNH